MTVGVDSCCSPCPCDDIEDEVARPYGIVVAITGQDGCGANTVP